MRKPKALALAVAAALTACTGPLEPVWLLANYRILGVKSAPAEAMPGDHVTMTLVDADVRSRPVSTVWFLCERPVNPLGDAGTSSGTFGGCPSAQTQLNTGSTVDFTVPLSVPDPSLDELGREIFTVIGYSCAGGTIGPPTSGSPLPTCMGNDPQGWLFTRSIYVHVPGSLNPPNQNPQIDSVMFGGTPATVFPLSATLAPHVPRCADQMNFQGCAHWTVQTLFTQASREGYTHHDPIDGTLRQVQERLSTGYVVTAGTLDGGFRTDSDLAPESSMENTWRAPAQAGAVTFYVYASDGRGGFDWTTRGVVVE